MARKDGIGEEEKELYLEAAVKHGNNWKEIMKFIVKNGQGVLPRTVYRKYIEAESDSGKMKSIRSRIGNIRRRMK